MALKNKKILITCGPTWVPIDDVRVISNTSTGSLGQTIARDLKTAGAKITLLEGPVKEPIKEKSVKVIKFSYFNELSVLLKKELKKNYDIVIHAAAVSDYKLTKKLKEKISSKFKKLKLELVPTEKLINIIKKINDKVFLVGFKLEPKMTKQVAKKESDSLISQAKCNLVVANSNPNKRYCAYILDSGLNILAKDKTRKSVSKSLTKVLKEAYL
ncbi:MAG: phosphopantothenoylcysteine decarboxylase [Candidatus Zapsychrus exili]|nr:phosphopantothenoylcysteine decarboxylase [Candidatus Zapsychrus exili]